MRRLAAFAGRHVLLLAWLAAGVAVLVVSWLDVSASYDLTVGMSGGAAGDALQVHKGLVEHWFLTGQHAGVGPPHPGPFALWIRALVEFAAPYVGMSSFALMLLAFTALKVAALFTAAALVAGGLRSWVAAPLFASGVVVSSTLPLFAPGGLLEAAGPYVDRVPGVGAWLAGMEPVGIAGSPLAAWAVLGVCAAAIGWIRESPGWLLALTVFSGVLVHVNGPAAPVGVAGLVCVVAAVLTRRWWRGGEWYLSIVVWLVLVGPLVYRVVRQWPWPFTYVASVQDHVGAVAASGVSRPRFELLGDMLGVPTSLAFWVVAVPAGVALLLAFVKRVRWPALLLAFVSGWAAIVVFVSPAGQVSAGELTWICGVVAFWAGLGLALLGAVLVDGPMLLVGRIPGGRWPGGAVRLVAAAAVAGLLLYPGILTVFASEPAGKAGGSYGYDVGPAADAVVTKAGPATVGFAPGVDWQDGGMQLVLELQQRGVPYCVFPPADPAFRDRVGVFFAERDWCTAADVPFRVSSSAGENVAWTEVLFTMPGLSSESGPGRAVVFGIPDCVIEPSMTACLSAG